MEFLITIDIFFLLLASQVFFLFPPFSMGWWRSLVSELFFGGGGISVPSRVADLDLPDKDSISSVSSSVKAGKARGRTIIFFFQFTVKLLLPPPNHHHHQKIVRIMRLIPGRAGAILICFMTGLDLVLKI